MKVASTHTYSAPPDAVFAVMTSPDVMVAKYRALGHQDVKIVEHLERAGIISIRSRRGVPLEPPIFAKRFFDPVNVVDQHDEWDPPMSDGSRWGIWQVSARGVPVTTGGQMHLAPTHDGRGTIVEVSGEVMCPMPIVGGRIAAFVGDDVERTLHEEEAFLDGYLREHEFGRISPPREQRAS
jgi:uncharacterized Zn-binding protein involved in type VI secretion